MQLRSFVVLACLAVLFSVGSAQIAAHKITDLPGLTFTPNFNQYAGYLTLANGRGYFYWFVESQRSPASDPLLLWLNGGPGCSSLGGLLSENGPFYPDENGHLIQNPYAWNTVANVLYLESPAGVGFSYGAGSTIFTDNTTAVDNYQFLVQWFQKYPSYAHHDFYITGESYAGHYIPELAQQIFLNLGRNPGSPPQSNFKGFMVGNPSTNNVDDFGEGLTKYYQTHGIIALDDNSQNHANGNFNPYDILVDVCATQRMLNYIRFPHPVFTAWREKQLKLAEEEFRSGSTRSKRDVPAPDPCIDNYVTSYLNMASVQRAVHANPVQWVECGGPQYQFYDGSIVPLYKEFMDKTRWKIMVYSGDADTVINFISTETWINQLGRPLVSQWAPWYHLAIGAKNGKQVAGWRVVFDRIEYRTVKGAGHMVPWFQPSPALAMLKDFLNA